MHIMSSVFRNGEQIPPAYSRNGGDKSPPFHIEGVPLQSKSLVLIMDDPDAPRGTFTHWILFNLDPRRVEIEEDQTPEEAGLGMTDWGKAEYGGPKPPSGEHRYYFRLYALDKMLELPNGSTRQQIERAMKGHVITIAEFMGRYAAAAPVSAES